MLQKSVYTKLCLNGTISEKFLQRVKINKPKVGLVQLLVITEKQYSSMETIAGITDKTTIDDMKRTIVL